VRVAQRTRMRFFEQVAECLGVEAPDVRFVFSLREDHLPELDEAREVLSDIFANSYRLVNLSRDKARLAVTEPAARTGIKLVPDLVDTLLDGLSDAGRIAPPQLQIVCDRLYRECLSNPEGVDRGEPPELVRRELILADYQVLGGAERILADYVHQALARLTSEQQEMAQGILKVMVTSKATKAALNREELLRELAQAEMIDFQQEQDRIEALKALAGLVDVRLIRSFEQGGEALFELAHDHMAAEIATWISEEEMQTKLVRELLRRELEAWRDFGKLIETESLRIINEQRDDLKRPTNEELELLVRSALAAEYEVPYWRERAPAIIQRIEDELFGCLGSGEVGQVQQAISGLVALTSPLIIDRLAELVEAGFTDEPRVWVDHQGHKHYVRHTVLNLATGRQRDALLALTKMAVPEATEVLSRWTPPGVILIPAGPFTMGSTVYNDEGPVHEVWLDAFWVDRYPVTNAQWVAFLEDGSWERKELWTKAGWSWKTFESPEPKEWDKHRHKLDHPVVGISWYEALAYARWTGKSLLNEAQWEKAARRTDGRQYPWGDEFDQTKCNVDESGIGETTPVGRYSPAGDSPYGVADMTGNVWEWTASMYRPYPYRPDDGRNDLEIEGPRVARGGSFYAVAVDARCSYRLRYSQHVRFTYYGVRAGVVVLPSISSS